MIIRRVPSEHAVTAGGAVGSEHGLPSSRQWPGRDRANRLRLACGYTDQCAGQLRVGGPDLVAMLDGWASDRSRRAAAPARPRPAPRRQRRRAAATGGGSRPERRLAGALSVSRATDHASARRAARRGTADLDAGERHVRRPDHRRRRRSGPASPSTCSPVPASTSPPATRRTSPTSLRSPST